MNMSSILIQASKNYNTMNKDLEEARRLCPKYERKQKDCAGAFEVGFLAGMRYQKNKDENKKLLK